ncbi:hypothetical protein CVD28_19895 [Bacillus sp. M6-12]|uniref:helix-turn-helix domain-containing protein n=1 Tax=Bacillus sp. M6-12 TaxID=2054166 RepID=UPI000C78FD7C|nr:helix-turn-helix domain-containing protein [Bacillus sp. M6-12]PLS15925.1 hypothetical protein CVD28_19895 [Bacillus sp. M6-12]
MKMYTVDEVFNLLKSYKITTHKESVRRWLRQGIIKGIKPASRKEGWLIPKDSLDEFIKKRMPNEFNTTIIANKTEKSNTTFDVKKIEEQARTKMWIELANKNIWEGYIELKKTRIHECIQHRRYSKDLEAAVWKACLENSRGYSKPRIFYLLEAFGFGRKRLLLDKNFESLEEQIIFSLIEHIRGSMS